MAADEQVNRFYRVEYPEGQIAWVYRSFVRRESGDPPGTVVQVDGHLEVHVINVGQGDAIWIRCPHGTHQLLIDSGDTRYPGSSASFRKQLSFLQDQSDPLEVVVATHPHADHIGSLGWVLENYDILFYVASGIASSSAVFGKLEESLELSGVERANLTEAVADIDFCPSDDVSAVLLRPEGFGTLHDPNDGSVVVRVDYGSSSLLFVGDAEEGQERQLLEDPNTRLALDCDFLKVGHHGSDTSTSEEFLEVVSPSIAAVSCGAPGVGTNAGYKHPRASTIDRLLRYVRPDVRNRSMAVYDSSIGNWTTRVVNRAVHCTFGEGDLVFVSDGDEIRIERED